MTRTIARDDLRIRLGSTSKPVLLEALPARYYKKGHLPGALHMPHDEVAALAPQVLPDKSADVIVYCASATCQNSHIAAAELERLGYRNVSVYVGGKEDWQGADLPLEAGASRT